jgi:hypothetical protein
VDYEAIELLRDTLEVRAPPSVIDALLPSAAMFIKYAGRQIYWDQLYSSRKWKVRKDGRPEFWAGELYTGLEGFCKRRWYFWKQGFEEVSDRADLEETTRKLGRETAHLMDAIENENCWTQEEEQEYAAKPAERVEVQDGCESVRSTVNSCSDWEGSDMDLSDGKSEYSVC